MGNGRFVNGKLNFIVSADFTPSAAQVTTIRTCITSASDFLYHATGGQVQFGDVYMTDGNSGLVDAEIVFLQAGDLSGGSRGKFGTPNVWVKMCPSDHGNSRILVHELSHHLWNLGDEYAGPQYSIQIDKSSPAPDLRTIPISNGPPANSLVNQLVSVRFAPANDVRRNVVSNTTTRIVVSSDYPDLPTNSVYDSAWLQDTTVGCGVPSTSGVSFCIMEDYSPGVTEFCHAANHNALQNTDQQLLHNESCWETILSLADFSSLTVPSGSPSAPPAPVNFVDILKENRYALVFDRSGSMAGDKLAYAKEGVKYWIDNCTIAADQLSLIAYKANNNILLPIVQAGSIPNLAALEGSVDAITATGQTNIRDAIREGVAQIVSVPNKAVTQAVIVLTDGKHNRPQGTSLTEALPDLLDNGVKAVTIAIGDAGGVDASDLDQIAFESGGIMQLVGLSNPIDIETALIEASLYLSGSLADSSTFDFVPPPPLVKKAKAELDPLYKRKKSPTFIDVMRALRIRDRDIASANVFRPYEDLFQTREVYIERGCQKVNFTINYDLRADFDLFLIDPAGAPVDANGTTVVKIAHRKSHKIFTVNKPRSGVWTVVVLARRILSGGQVSTVNLSVGAENRALTVVGGRSKPVYRTNENVKLFARASYETPLSGIVVRASIRSAGGASYSTDLNDGGSISITAGDYSAEISNLKAGMYKGVISIEGKAKTSRADALHRLGHSTVPALNAQSGSPKFRRVVPVSFQVKSR